MEEGYWSNLLNGGNNNLPVDNNSLPTDGLGILSCVRSNKRILFRVRLQDQTRKGQKKNIKEKEDALLVSAWLNITTLV